MTPYHKSRKSAIFNREYVRKIISKRIKCVISNGKIKMIKFYQEVFI